LLHFHPKDEYHDDGIIVSNLTLSSWKKSRPLSRVSQKDDQIIPCSFCCFSEFMRESKEIPSQTNG
jgi:hypothetical protein